MRKIKVLKWKGKDTKGQVVEENTILMLTVLINNKGPDTMPRGIDNFRLMHRLSKAIDKAEKTGTLILEETEYLFVKKLIETDVPSSWGMNQNILDAVELILNPEEV